MSRTERVKLDLVLHLSGLSLPLVFGSLVQPVGSDSIDCLRWDTLIIVTMGSLKKPTKGSACNSDGSILSKVQNLWWRRDSIKPRTPLPINMLTSCILMPPKWAKELMLWDKYSLLAYWQPCVGSLCHGLFHHKKKVARRMNQIQ